MSKKTKIIFFSVSGLVILIAFATTLIFALAYFLSSQYGVTTISVGGKQVYFKREVRSLNYDRIILSPNNDYCADYNPETDFTFPSMDDVIYYKINGEVLQLISSAAIQPKTFPVKVEVQEIENPFDWLNLKNTYKAKGIEFLEVRVNKRMWCFLK